MVAPLSGIPCPHAPARAGYGAPGSPTTDALRVMKRSGPVVRFADRQNAGITPTRLPESGLQRIKSDIGRHAFASEVPSHKLDLRSNFRQGDRLR
jgi:hypothetical protein